jgi:hypothetical protein
VEELAGETEVLEEDLLQRNFLHHNIRFEVFTAVTMKNGVLSP